MPSRSARRHTTLASLATMLGLVASVPSSAQQLSLPSDPLAGTVISSSAQPVSSAGASPLSSAPMSPDAGMIEQGPVSASSAGSYYNPLLGSHIRARFNTQSYGQQAGTLDLGTMKLMPLDDGMAFLDGQVTLNDESHVGYNLGVGYRWMTLPLFPFSPDDRKIMGVSVWSDGGSKGGSNFFPQIGTSLEFLGDRIDFRANGYAPIGNRTQTRDFTPTTTEGYTGNGIGRILQGIEDTALTVGEAELAGRLGNFDAWAFAGVYGMRGGAYDAVGGKIGLRGYVTPDLFLSVGVANDDEFDTNALVNLTWFIGRTRAENAPTGVLEDRLREPVLRNNYVASQERVVTRVGDVARALDGTDLRIVHIDSTAADGGDGTFERPFNSLDDITDASTLANDTLLFHGGSDFNDQQAVLLDGQIALGEGGDFVTTIDTFELGTIDLPETATGAQAGPRPTIDGGASAGIVLADGNTVQNLEFDGGVNAIVNEANGSNGATLNNLSIANTTGDGISLTAFVGADADDIDDDGDTTEEFNILGTVAISDITFDGVAGNDIDIDADTGTLDDADIIAESITISGITSNNTSGSQSIAIRNTTAAGTASVTDLTYDGGATGAGGLLIEQTAGSVSINGAELTGGAGTAATFTGATGSITATDITYDGADTSAGGLLFEQTEGAVNLNGAELTGGLGTAAIFRETTGTVTASNITYDGEATADGGLLLERTEASVTVSNSTLTAGTGAGITVNETSGPVSIGSTVEITDIGGKSVVIANTTDGAPNGVAVAATISNTTVDGGGITIDSNESIVSFTGDITTQNDQSVVINDSQANITISGDIDDNGTGDAITINNAGIGTDNTAEVAFSGNLDNEEGRSLAINGGDDDIFIATNSTGSNSGTYTDDGDGILIENRLADTEVTFGTPASQVTINSETSNGVTLSGNDETSIVTFLADLDITTTSGTGIVSDEGQLDASNAGNTITTESGAALNLTGGSSTTGLRFENVTTNDSAVAGNAPAVAVNLQEFDGITTISDGVLRSTGVAADVLNAGLVLSSVDIDSDMDAALTARYTDDVDRVLSITEIDANGGNFLVTSNGDGSIVATISEATNVGQVTYATDSTTDDVFNLTDVSTDDAFDFTASNTGGLDVNMTDIISTGGGIAYASTGSGESTLDVTRSGTVNNAFVGNLNLDLAGAGTLTANLADTDFTGTGEVTFDAEGTNSGALALTDFTTTGSYTYTTTVDAGLGVTMTDVEGVNTTFASGGSANSTLAMTDATMSGNFDYDVTGDGNLTTTMTNVVGVGDTTLDVEGEGDGLLTMTNVNTGGALTATGSGVSAGSLVLNVTDSGNDTDEEFTAVEVQQAGSGIATASFTDVTADSGIDFDSASDTLSSLSVTDGDYGGSIDFDETGDGDANVSVIGNNSTGALTVDEAGEGNATLIVSGGEEFAGGIVFNETGDGNATATLTDVTTTGGGLTVNEQGEGNATLADTDGNYDGPIDFDEVGDGNATVTLSDTTSTAGVTVDETDDGTATLTMQDGNYAGDILFDEAGAGVANATLTNVTSTGAVDYDTAGEGGGSFAVSGGTFGGPITADAANGTTGNFAASVTNGTVFTASPQIAFNSDNTGSIDYEVSGLAFATGDNINAIDLAFGSNVSTADVSVTSNTNIQTLDGSALSLSFDSGVVDFLLSGNTFGNNSASDTVLVSHSGTTLNATITGNSFTNTGAGDEFDLTNPSGSTTNLAITTNGLVGADFELTNNSASALAFRVRADDEASVNSNNDATINFNPAAGNFTFENTLIVPTP